MKTRRLKIDIQKLVIVGVLIIIMAVLAILTPKFLTYLNFNNVIMQVALIMLTAAGLSAFMGCATATLTWNSNPEDDIAGYFLYYSKGSSGSPYTGVDAAPGQVSGRWLGTGRYGVLGTTPERSIGWPIGAAG